MYHFTGCIDEKNHKHLNGTTYEFKDSNGDIYSCDCKNNKAVCAKGFLIPGKGCVN